MRKFFVSFIFSIVVSVCYSWDWQTFTPPSGLPNMFGYSSLVYEPPDLPAELISCGIGGCYVTDPNDLRSSVVVIPPSVLGRRYFPNLLLRQDVLMVYGGYDVDNGNFSNSCLLFETGAWQRILDHCPGFPSAVFLGASANVPSTYIEMVIVGGLVWNTQSQQYEPSNSLYFLEHDGATVRRLPESYTMTPRFMSSAAPIDMDLYVFGGLSRNMTTNETLVLNDLVLIRDYKDYYRPQLVQLSSPAVPRYGHQLLLFGTMLIMLGGFSADGAMVEFLKPTQSGVLPSFSVAYTPSSFPYQARMGLSAGLVTLNDPSRPALFVFGGLSPPPVDESQQFLKNTPFLHIWNASLSTSSPVPQASVFALNDLGMAPVSAGVMLEIVLGALGVALAIVVIVLGVSYCRRYSSASSLIPSVFSTAPTPSAPSELTKITAHKALVGYGHTPKNYTFTESGTPAVGYGGIETVVAGGSKLPLHINNHVAFSKPIAVQPESFMSSTAGVRIKDYS